MGLEQLERQLGDAVKVHRGGAHPREVGHSKDAGQPRLDLGRARGLGLDEQAAVQQPHRRFRPQSVAQALGQELLEVAAVLPLEPDLVIVHQETRRFYHRNNLAAFASVTRSISANGTPRTPASASRV